MSDDLRRQIFSRMSAKDTGELLEIWQTNDRVEWSAAAFDVIHEILVQRGMDVPPQDAAIEEYADQYDAKNDDREFSPWELKIINDENPPDFYDPFKVLDACKQIEWVARIMVGLAIFANLVNFHSSLGVAQSFFYRSDNEALVFLIAVFIALLNTALGSLVVYFPLLALATTLKLLMEMEFNSRKAG